MSGVFERGLKSFESAYSSILGSVARCMGSWNWGLGPSGWTLELLLTMGIGLQSDRYAEIGSLTARVRVGTKLCCLFSETIVTVLQL